MEGDGLISLDGAATVINHLFDFVHGDRREYLDEHQEQQTEPAETAEYDGPLHDAGPQHAPGDRLIRDRQGRRDDHPAFQPHADV